MKSFAAIALSAALLVPVASAAPPQSGSIARLTIYDAGIAEVLEERTVALQSGMNVVEWRSLLPNAQLSTLRVTVDGADVVRQDVTMDGARVGSTTSPVLHLQIRSAAAGPRVVRVDYLVPGIDWSNAYALVFDQDPSGAPPTTAELESWISVDNEMGTDLHAGAIDLVAGEVSLIGPVRGISISGSTSNQIAIDSSDDSEVVTSGGLGAFTRIPLGKDVTLPSNAEVSRFPLFQRVRVLVVQRNVFENDHNDQTLARGGFVLLPRGLEVRLVSENTTGNTMPAGIVTVYARTGGFPQIVGQDRIGHTTPGETFAAMLGRSSTLLGTRRIVESRREEYRESDGDTAYKKITTIEVELTNRSKVAAEAFVRDGIEPFGQGNWSIVTSSARHERLGANTIQFAVTVPPGGKTKVTYTVEIT